MFLRSLHPLSAFLSLLSVIVLSMLSNDPIAVLLAYFSSVFVLCFTVGGKSLLKNLPLDAVFIAIITLTNAAFVHKGDTVLFYIFDEKITLQALIYGFFSSLMILSVMHFCRVFTEVVDDEKFMYLFGGAFPKLSLMLCLTLAFIPRMRRRMNEIEAAQTALGIYSQKSYMDKLKVKANVFSTLLTLSLEGAMQTADSMRARGYGLQGRTRGIVYRFSLRDGFMIVLTLPLTVLSSVFLLAFKTEAFYYPHFALSPSDAYTVITYILLILLYSAFAVTEIKERLSWHYLKSKI